MRRHTNVVNLDEIEPWTPPAAGPPPFGASVKRVASAAGSKQIGANLFHVPAGKTAVGLNFDMFLPYGRARDVTVNGGLTTVPLPPFRGTNL